MPHLPYNQQHRKSGAAANAINRNFRHVTFLREEPVKPGGATVADRDRNLGLLRAMMNPSSFTESISANYARQIVPGLSHEVMQFVNTSNLKVEFEIYFRATTEFEVLEMQKARRRLLSWVYPTANSGNISGGGAPNILVLWPSMLSFEAYLTNVVFTHERFHHTLAALQSRARVTFEGVINKHRIDTLVDADTSNTFDTDDNPFEFALSDGEFR